MASAQIEPAVASDHRVPAAASSDRELLAERVLLGIIAVLATLLVPDKCERLIDTPLTWADLARALQRQQPRGPSPR